MILSLNSLFGRKGESFEFEKSFELKEKDLLETVGITACEPIFCKGSVVSYGDTLALKATYEVELHKLCDRCLIAYDESIEGVLQRTVSKEAKDGLDNIEAGDGNVNLHDILSDELMTVVSSQSLCDEDCKGLCTECGIDLNEESCECHKNDIDPRFRALLDL
ncbi:MAG: DUF177 domain-containing protein [Bacillota bacterium]|nr:DUF177 domain-containing protein [Bacillota bacterium]